MRYLDSPGASTRDLKRRYRVWHGKQEDRDELPSHGTFLGNDAFGSLLPLVYAARDDPSVLDGPLTLPGEKQPQVSRTPSGDPLLDVFATLAGRPLLELLRFVATRESATVSEMHDALGGCAPRSPIGRVSS